jgi:SAM-dependent methyltransferase
VIDLSKHYNGYYGDTWLATWRELSARDKAANVIALWEAACEKTVKIKKIADIGCGDGAVIQELCRREFGESYVGFEVSRSGLASAKQRHYAKPCRFVLFDGVHLPSKKAEFDLALLSHVLEHVEEPRHLLREAAQIARFVFIEVPLEMNVRTPRDFRWTETGHINLYNPLLIRHLVQSVGLQIKAERLSCSSRAVFTFQRSGLPGTLHWMLKAALMKVAPFVARRIFTYHGSLIARSIDKVDP